MSALTGAFDGQRLPLVVVTESHGGTISVEVADILAGESRSELKEDIPCILAQAGKQIRRKARGGSGHIPRNKLPYVTQVVVLATPDMELTARVYFGDAALAETTMQCGLLHACQLLDLAARHISEPEHSA